MGHSHAAVKISRTQEASTTSRTARLVVTIVLAALTLLTVVGMAWLWPDWNHLAAIRHQPTSFSTAAGVSFENAKILEVTPRCIDTTVADTPTPSSSRQACLRLKVHMDTGPEKGQTVTVESVGPAAESNLSPGDMVQVMRSASASGSGNNYSFSGVHRTGPIMFFALLFVVVVVAVARWKGVFSLLGLGFATAIIGFFMLPALASGRPGIWVGLVGASAIMLVVIHVAHGVSMRTAAAMLGTLCGLILSALFGTAAVWLGHLSGYVDDMSFDLSANIPHLSMRQLLIVAIILAGLGVLNDVTITQTSSVWELRLAAPHYTRWEVYRSAMRIGCDHIASTIYTVVFAYTGAALATVMLIVMFYDRPFSELFATESIAAELLQILTSASALILSLPLTTAIAALMIRKAKVANADAVENSAS